MIQKHVSRSKCPTCEGYRMVDGEPCTKCDGTGKLSARSDYYKLQREAHATKYQARPAGAEIDAPFIQAALKRKYGRAPWIYLPELRNASGHNANRTIDGYAIETGTDPTLLAFEIKITRGDWLRELKAEKYKEWFHLCHRLYFVTPPGLIEPDEVPDPCGLIECDSRGNTRYIRRGYCPTGAAQLLPLDFVAVLTKRCAYLEDYV